MKKSTTIISVLMALLILVMGPMTALAQDDEEAAADYPKSFWKGSLAIVAPRIAPVGEEISMTVFLRANQEPFTSAGVWAITKERAEVLKEELAALREQNGLASSDTDLEGIISIHGTFLGRTDENGKLYHAFDQAGHYLLATVKKHYLPGFTRINIGTLPQALGIEAPRRAPVGEDVTITVFQRRTEEPVEGAGIWALSREEAEVLREEMKALCEDASIAAEEKDYESLVDIHGDFLGRTDEDGELSVAFSSSGIYLLVGVKKGYFPGVTIIGVHEMPAPTPLPLPSVPEQPAPEPEPEPEQLETEEIAE